MKPGAVGRGATYLEDLIRPGAWAGRRVFVVCGGPSLRGFDFSLLEGELTIGVNRAYERFTPTINFSMDPEFFSMAETGKFGAEMQERWHTAEFIRCFLEHPDMPYPPDIARMRWDREAQLAGFPKWPDDKGMYAGPNSGYAAIMTAAWLGSKEIYVLGLDCSKAPDGAKWYHDGYEQKSAGEYPERAVPYFEKLAPFLSSKGVRIVNLSPRSHLSAWPRAHWSSVWKTIEVRAHLGFGDNIYEAPFIREMADSGQWDRVYVRTPFPQLHVHKKIRFLPSKTPLRAQAKAEQAWGAWCDEPDEYTEKFSFYRADAQGYMLPRPHRFTKALHLKPKSMQVMDMKIHHDWVTRAMTALMKAMPADVDKSKKLCLVKQPTLRKEWLIPSRNPDPKYLQSAMDQLRDRYVFVSVADLKAEEEWLDGRPLHAEARLLNGELDLFGVAGLAWIADLIITGPSFMIPLALSMGKPILCLYGGFEGPEMHFSEEFYGSNPRQVAVMPKPFCNCRSMKHECNKEIDPQVLFAAVEQAAGGVPVEA